MKVIQSRNRLTLYVLSIHGRMHVQEELTNKKNKPNAMKIIGLWGRKKKKNGIGLEPW